MMDFMAALLFGLLLPHVNSRTGRSTRHGPFGMWTTPAYAARRSPLASLTGIRCAGDLIFLPLIFSNSGTSTFALKPVCFLIPQIEMPPFIQVANACFTSLGVGF